MLNDKSITIITPINSKYVGVYDNGGAWTQANGANLATDLAVFEEVPEEAGVYVGNIYQNTDTFYEADYLFTATFIPVEVGRVDCKYTADIMEFESTGCGVEEPVSYSSLTTTRILEQYK